MRCYHVYILASRSRQLYVGVTRNLYQRLTQHRAGECEYTARYRIVRLVLVEETNSVMTAVTREKQIKGWTRARKVALIESMNPGWDDLMPHEDRSADPSLRSG